MMRSMFSGVSGLRIHQTRMDVIGNNIANVNTAGFKSQRVTFADAFSQTLRGASAPNPDLGRGGLNPMQIGLGANVAAISTVFTPGGAQRTDAPLDLMIEGDGFFIVGDNVQGNFFTRAGHFIEDYDGWIVAPNGMVLQGWPATDAIPPEILRGPVQGIQIRPEQRNLPPSATGDVRFSGNLDPTTPRALLPMNFRDSLGNNWQIHLELIPATEPPANIDGSASATGERVYGAWDIRIAGPLVLQGGPRDAVRPEVPRELVHMGRMFFDDHGNMIHIDNTALAAGDIDDYGRIASGVLADRGDVPDGYDDDAPRVTALYMRFDGPMFEVPPGTPTDPPPDAGLGGMYSVFGQIHSTMPGQADDAEDFIRAIRMCFRAMLQHEGRNNVTFTDVNGREAGTLIGISIGQDGIVSGTYSNGESRELWQIAMARFSNPAGLMRMGNSLFAQTRNSGTFDGIGFEPGAIGANLLGGTLEMSNVDLGFEFTEMITTQRGFQANSRIITTTDEMLQELVNLRR